MNIGIINVVIIIISLIIAIFIHELGHFLLAKLIGVRIIEFSIGLGPKIIKKKRKNTLYAFRLVPLGGFVLIASKLIVLELSKSNPKDYKNIKKIELLDYKKWWQKILFYFAGISFNFVFALFLALFIDYLIYDRWIFNLLVSVSGKNIGRLFEEIFTGNLFNASKSEVSSIVGATYNAIEKSVSIEWYYFYYLNLAIIIFNLLPIPPLDGYKIIEVLFLKFIYKKELKTKTLLTINIIGSSFIGLLFVILLVGDIIKIA